VKTLTREDRNRLLAIDKRGDQDVSLERAEHLGYLRGWRVQFTAKTGSCVLKTVRKFQWMEIFNNGLRR
jgi:hypothetical protein